MNAIFIPGYAESKGSMKKVAETAANMGIVDHFEIYSLPRAYRDSDEIDKRLNDGAVAITHSAGILAVGSMSSNLRPGRMGGLFAYNGPENGDEQAWTRRELIASSNRKTGHHLREVARGIVRSSEADEPARRAWILAGNAKELVAHPIFNWKMLGKITTAFTTTMLLTSAAEEGIPVAHIMSEHDEFFSPSLTDTHRLNRWDIPWRVIEDEGHDGLLVHPDTYLEQTRDLLAA